MVTIESLIKMLTDVVKEPSQLANVIINFQRIVWKEKVDELRDELPQTEILLELAYDLDFYEPDIVSRRESPSFFGEEMALNRISTALLKLKNLKENADKS